MELKSRINCFIESVVCSRRDANILKAMEKVADGEKTALDVGCGNGRFTEKIREKFNLDIQGIDIYSPKNPKVPVSVFDGKKIPFPNNSFDSVFFIDVLHHTSGIEAILKEALRVSRKSIIIKDHYCENAFDTGVLKIADFFGNLSLKVPVPFNFKSSSEWDQILKNHPIEKIVWDSPILPGVLVHQVMYKVHLTENPVSSSTVK